jgi:CBS domain-containing protein
MQIVSDVMTRNVMFVSPQESLLRAAQMMDELNVGSLPVCDGERLVGMVTDRDITVRGTAAGKAPRDAHVDEVMSADVRWCFEDQALDEVMQQMADTQIRRVPVVSHDESHRLVGIVALGDLRSWRTFHRLPDRTAQRSRTPRVPRPAMKMPWRTRPIGVPRPDPAVPKP